MIIFQYIVPLENKNKLVGKLEMLSSLSAEMIQFDEHILQMGWLNHQLVINPSEFFRIILHCKPTWGRKIREFLVLLRNTSSDTKTLLTIFRDFFHFYYEIHLHSLIFWGFTTLPTLLTLLRKYIFKWFSKLQSPVILRNFPGGFRGHGLGQAIRARALEFATRGVQWGTRVSTFQLGGV